MAFGLKRNKKDEIHKGELMVAEGVYLKQATMKNGHIIFNCFLRALIVFFLVFGSICGFLSAFDISYNIIMVIIVFLLLSMYFSFLYSASRYIYRDIGYIVFFAIFVATIYFLRIYANSGFYYIVNKVLSYAKTFFDLPGVREYEVTVNNDYITVSIVACFIGMLMIIILNIWMYSMMSIFWTVLFTFPLLLIPTYMKLSPGLVYITCLSVGYLAVIIFSANGHYVVFAWDTPFKTKGKRKKQVSYTQDSGIFRQMIGSLLVLSMIIVFITGSIMSPVRFQQKFKSERLWNKTSDAVGNFVLLGFSSFFNRYSSTGGMSSGKLGGISNVRPNYMTDLEVTFVPYGNEGIYLKGFTGGIYDDNQWLSLRNEMAVNNNDDLKIFEEESLKNEMEILENDWGEYSGSGIMRIENVGADTSYLYYPYYTKFDDYSVYNDSDISDLAHGILYGQTVDYNFYPKIIWEERLGDIKPGDMDISKVNSVFLDVPDKNKEVISEICDEIGLNENMTENEIVEEVTQFFSDNYPYTLRPGQTPRNQDFINYFLTKNKKGYCAHFASSAVLIFREMGIPARYVEGYAFSMETVLASDEAEGLKASDFYNGYSAIGEAPVMHVEVSDAQAHAWVEIYIDGFGWKNVEVTPGSNEAIEDDDFWSAFSPILQGGIGNFNGGDLGEAIKKLDLGRYSWLIYVLFAIILLGIVIFFVKIAVRKARRYMLCHQRNVRDAVIAGYADVCDMIRVCDVSFDTCRSHKEQLEYINNRYELSIDVDTMKSELEKMSYHDEYPDEQKLAFLCDMIKKIRKQIYNKEQLKNRVKLWKR